MIEIKNLTKKYDDVTPLKDVNVTINDGDIISVIGPSGTGKSTFLRCINLLETPTSGQILLNGEDITEKGADIKKYRQKMGMVFQSFNLFGHLTVIENLMLAPMDLLKKSKKEAYEKGMEFLKRVGLADKMLAYPDELSGGELRRLSVARALINSPSVIFADEPTNDLDEENATLILKLLKDQAERGAAVIAVTHDSSALAYADKVYEMNSGRLIGKEKENDTTICRPLVS